MILLWGIVGDSPLRLVLEALEQRDASVVFLNQADVLDTSVRLSTGDLVSGAIRVGDETWRLEDVDAMYVRPYDFRMFAHLEKCGDGSPEWTHASAVDDVLLSFAEIMPGVVLNRPSAMQSNGSKPYQCRLIEQSGFVVPDTLVTTDAEAARVFWRRHEEVIYKSISGRRSIVTRLSEEHKNRLEDLAWCPTQFQACVEGTDYRVHVVGERTFTSRVYASGTDYRYGPHTFKAVRLDDDVTQRCVRLAHDLDLPLAGIDLRQTSDGEWVCFEVNPSPAYSAYELATGESISSAIADALQSGVVCGAD